MRKNHIYIILFIFILFSSLSYALQVIPSGESSSQTNGSQKTKIVDAFGNTIASDIDSDGTYHLSTSVIQDVHVIPSNSSTSNLGAGNTFTGVSSLTLGGNSIQVTLKTDVNCIVYVDQSSDGINWDISDTFNYYYSVNNFGVTVQSIGSYFRVRVKNTSTVSSTYFRLQSIICPVVEALPRSLNEDGHLKVKTYGIEDEYGFDSENTPNGEIRTVQPTLLVGKSFEGTIIDTNFWNPITTASANVTQGNDTITLSTGSAANGSAILHSVRRARYIPGQAHVARFQTLLGDTGASNNTRKWGSAWGSSLSSVTDGAYFKLSGSTFSVNTLKGGSESSIASGNFNGKYGGSYALDTNYHTYEIYWNNRFVFFTIDGLVLHTVTASSSTWTNTVQNHIYFENKNNNGAATNNSITCSAAGIRRLGPLLSQPTSKYQTGAVNTLVLKYGLGNLHGIAISSVINNSVVTLYDNTTSSGTIIWNSGPMSNQTIPFFIDLKGIPFFNGLTLSIGGANSNVTVLYE